MINMPVYIDWDDGSRGDDMEFCIYQSYSVPPDDCIFLSRKDLIDLKRQIDTYLSWEHMEEDAHAR